MRMSIVGIVWVGLLNSGLLWADAVPETPKKMPETVKVEKSEKIEKKESKKTITQNINHTIRIQNEGPANEKLNEEVKYFCSSSSKEEAEKNCNSWLKAQKKQASSRVVFSSCSQAQDLYGESQHGCMAYLCTGEIKFLLNQRK